MEYQQINRAFTPLQSLGVWFGVDNAVNGVAGLLSALVPRRERRGYGAAHYFGGFDKGKNLFYRGFSYISSVFVKIKYSLAQPFRAGVMESQQINRAFTPLQSLGVWFRVNNAVNGVAGLFGASDPRRERRGYGAVHYFGGFDKGKNLFYRGFSYISSIFIKIKSSLAQPFLRNGIYSLAPSFLRNSVYSLAPSFLRNGVHSLAPSFLRNSVYSLAPSFLRNGVHSLVMEFHPTHRAFTPLQSLFQSIRIWFRVNNAVNGVAGLLSALVPRPEGRGYGAAHYFGGFDKGEKFLLRKLFFIASILRNGAHSLAPSFRAGIAGFHPTHRAFTPLSKKEINFVSHLS